MSELDLGVWHVKRSDGPDWVARRFPARRSVAAVRGDAEILEYLATQNFPSERCAADEPVSELDGRAVLVTEWVEPVPSHQRREAIKADGGLSHLGELLGRLHTTALEGDALTRPGGAWHHLAEGVASSEVTAAAGALAELDPMVRPEDREAYEAFCHEVQDLDAGDGLPEALVHPDFVLPNVVASSEGMVMVDWAGAGKGPRLGSLAFLLYAEGARNLGRVTRVVAGYRRHVALDEAELSRLAAVMVTRPVVLIAWAVGTGHCSFARCPGQGGRSAGLGRSGQRTGPRRFRRHTLNRHTLNQGILTPTAGVVPPTSKGRQLPVTWTAIGPD